MQSPSMDPTGQAWRVSRCTPACEGFDNTGKMDFLRSLGADQVIDYTREDFTKNGKQYDLILDVIAHRSAIAYTRALNANGSCFVVGGSFATFFQILLLGPWIRRTRGK